MSETPKHGENRSLNAERNAFLESEQEKIDSSYRYEREIEKRAKEREKEVANRGWKRPPVKDWRDEVRGLGNIPRGKR